MHRLGVAAIGSLCVVAPCDVGVALHAETFFIERAEPEHRAQRRPARRGRTIWQLPRNWGPRPAFRRSARRPRRPPSRPLSTPPRATPARDGLRQSLARRYLHLGEPGRHAGRGRGRDCARDVMGCCGTSEAVDMPGRGSMADLGTVERVRRGQVVRLPADWRGRDHGWRLRRRRRSSEIVRRHQGRGRLSAGFHRRQLRRAVEQRHCHLERAEHDHDHARTDQQRAELGADGRGLLGVGFRIGRLCLGGLRQGTAGLFALAGCAAAAWAARRAAAMKLDVLTGSFLVLEISLIALSDAAIRSGGRRPGRGAGAGFERMVGRQLRLDRDPRRSRVRLQDLADRAWRHRWRDGRGRMEVARVLSANAPVRRDSAVRA